MNNTARPGWAAPRNTEPPAWVKALAVIAAVVAAFWATWCCVIVLIGGPLPLVGAQTSGSVPAFLLMLFIGEPALIALAYWTVKLILHPFTPAATKRKDH